MNPTTLLPYVDKLTTKHDVKCDAIRAAVKETQTAEKKLTDALCNYPSRAEMGSALDFVVCGSFARYEMTPHSDIDWYLLVDGRVDSDHSKHAGPISEALKDAGLKTPGSSGVFGNLVFSHDLVHNIGGSPDSNSNLTRRMLMLLESRRLEPPSNDPSPGAWENVIINIVDRYFEQDVHLSSEDKPQQVPRFLLNDISRYWRTICVDYAAKYRDQDGAKWAIRNAKLRLSRKLLFAAGLAFCFRCGLESQQDGTNQASGNISPLTEASLSFAKIPPLDYLARFIIDFVDDEEKQKSVTQKIMGSYNEWLSILSNENKRKHLECLSHEDAQTDSVFNNVRNVSDTFSTGLKFLFFNQEKNDDPIANLALDYVGF